MRECATAIPDVVQSSEPQGSIDLEVEIPPIRPPGSDSLRRVAAIDIGTNSTHLLIAGIDPDLRSFSVLLAEKSTTRLGERDSDTGDLSAEAMARTRLVLRHCCELARSHGVEQIVAVATSAMREAPNGLAFLASLREELSLPVEVISGPEEARLIHLGVLSGMDFGDRPHTILDIGGGSTELILADAREARALTSTRVGAVRLQRDFVRTDPLPRQRVEFLRAFILGSLEPAVDKVQRRLLPGEEPLMVATSGTALAAAALLAAEARGDGDSRPDGRGEKEKRPLPVGDRLHGRVVTRQQLDDLIERVLPLTPVQRRALPGINDRRSEILVPGLLVLQAAMQQLGAQQALEFAEAAGPLAVPDLAMADAAPVAVAEQLLVGQTIPGEGMADGHQQGQQLNRTAVAQGGPGEQPGDPGAGMAGQGQQPAAAQGLQVLGAMGFIHQQHDTARGQIPGQAGPAQQLGLQPEGQGFAAPVGMHRDGGDHQQTGDPATQQGPGRRQGGEGLAEPHLIGQQGAPAGQQPAGTGPLVGQQLPAIGQGFPKGGGGHQIPMGGQRRQGMGGISQPLQQGGIGVETRTELIDQTPGRLEGEEPAPLTGVPAAPGADGAHLGCGDGIKGAAQQHVAAVGEAEAGDHGDLRPGGSLRNPRTGTSPWRSGFRRKTPGGHQELGVQRPTH